MRYTSTSPSSTVRRASGVTRTPLGRTVLRSVGSLGNGALDCLFPRICVGCGAIGDFICARCARTLPFLNGPICPRCGQPQASGMLCPSCAALPGAASSIRSVFRFEGIVRSAIHELKYRNLRAIAPTLSTYLATYASDHGMSADVIVPIPLHPARRRRRGYNQAELLARGISEVLNIPVAAGAVTRRGEQTSQVRTRDVEERRRNVASAFTCTDESFSGKRILMVDDVCTTGATLEACAAALRASGALDVCGLTVAREV